MSQITSTELQHVPADDRATPWWADESIYLGAVVAVVLVVIAIAL